MGHKGWSHVGLATHDMDTTRAFYEGVLGFPVVRADTLRIREGGEVRHVFFDIGGGQLLAFIEGRDVPGVTSDFDAGINAGLGLPDMAYHFAFEAGSIEGLHAKRQELLAKGVEVSGVMDHEWSQSIYFKDPNNLSLEYCAYARSLAADDARMQLRAELSLLDLVPPPA
jgi:catechol 2,3-dioxygenase-like lactoylglutathione lyase family enzyme